MCEGTLREAGTESDASPGVCMRERQQARESEDERETTRKRERQKQRRHGQCMILDAHQYP